MTDDPILFASRMVYAEGHAALACWQKSRHEQGVRIWAALLRHRICAVQIQSNAATTQDARAITPEANARNSALNVIEESVRSAIPLGQTQ